MKKIIAGALAAIISIAMMSFRSGHSSSGIEGAWQLKLKGETHVIILIDGYLTHTSYDIDNRKFLQTRGGSFTTGEGRLSVNYEFDTRDKEQVGQTVSYNATIKDKILSTNITGDKHEWKNIDAGNANLAGLWKITARKQEGNMVAIHQTGTRKTIKILSGTRFQWAAIDPGTKQFMGTGGGTYTFKDGKYSEHIEFFSRDSSRVGAVLTFDGKLEGGDWHHGGLSSRGDPIYEVWSRNK